MLEVLRVFSELYSCAKDFLTIYEHIRLDLPLNYTQFIEMGPLLLHIIFPNC